MATERRRRRHLNEILMHLHQSSLSNVSNLQSRNRASAITSASRGASGANATPSFVVSSTANSYFPYSGRDSQMFSYAEPLQNNKKLTAGNDTISSLTAAEIQELENICKAPCPVVIKKFQGNSNYSDACSNLYQILAKEKEKVKE